MKQELKFAFVTTLPVLFGYLFAGAAFGLLLHNAGYGTLWSVFSCCAIYAGSMQFVMTSFLTAGTGLISVIITTFAVQSRHAFYGLSFVEKFRAMGKKMPYMIFSLTDETYSLLCSVKIPEGISEHKAFFLISLMNHLYWIAGGLLGGTLGSLIPFDTTGIDFAMTALFVVIFTEQCLNSKNKLPALIGALCGVISLIIFGPDLFILPALVATVGFLGGARRKILSAEAKK